MVATRASKLSGGGASMAALSSAMPSSDPGPSRDITWSSGLNPHTTTCMGAQRVCGCMGLRGLIVSSAASLAHTHGEAYTHHATRSHALTRAHAHLAQSCPLPHVKYAGAQHIAAIQLPPEPPNKVHGHAEVPQEQLRTLILPVHAPGDSQVGWEGVCEEGASKNRLHQRRRPKQSAWECHE
jgi:hypothetical protein